VEFFNKLKKTLETARDQMAGYCSAAGTRKIALVVINYDDMLHEYVRNYSAQIEAFVATKPVPDLEIVFDAKPAFYFATA
jgi:predicted xylose isomerase-like sugar epimerase